MTELEKSQQSKNIEAARQRLVTAFREALASKQKEFVCDGIEYVVRGRTWFIEKKYISA